MAASLSTPTRRRWATPLLLLPFALLLLAMTIQKLWAADTWWQLAAGRWMVEHRTVPSTDVFSYTAAGQEWIELRWLFCLATYLLWQAGGPPLLIALQAAMIAAAWIILIWPSRRALASPLGGGILLLGLPAGLGRWVLRPELTTYLLTAVFLVSLERLSRQGREPPSSTFFRRVSGWWLPLLQIVWVNAHTLFVMGPVLCWIYTAGDAAHRLADRLRGRLGIAPVSPRLLVLSTLVTLACLANPYFLRGALFPLTLWREIQPGHPLSRMIGEFQSPLSLPLERWGMDLFAAAALALAAAATFALRWRLPNLPRLLVFLAGVYLATKAQRNAGLLAIIASWAALRNISDHMAEHAPAPARAAAPRFLGNLAVSAAALALAWYIVTDRFWVSIGAPRESGIGISRLNTAEETARFLRDSGAKGPIFNAIGDGGYLIWAVPALPVFVDGRLEVYGEAFLVEGVGLAPSAWTALAAKRGFNTAIIPTLGHEPLSRALANSPDWKLVHLNWRDFVFARSTPENAAFIAAHTVDLGARVEPPPVPPTGESPDPWKLALGAPPRPWYYTALANAYMQLGSLGNAARFFDAALQRSPDHAGSIANLAAIERYRAGPRAQELAARLKPGSAWAIYSDQTLADLYRLTGRSAEAATPLERILEARPDDRAARLDLADLYFQHKDFPRARDHYRRALEGTTGPAEHWKKYGFALEQTGDDPSAADAYRISLAADPDQPQTLYLLALALARKGEFARASRLLESALKLQPDFPDAQKALDAVRRKL